MAILCFRCIFLSPGTIGFRHDWNWPPTQQASQGYLTSISYSWLPNSFGSPASYRSDFLLRAFFGFLSFIFDTDLIEKMFLFAITVTSSVSAYYLARAMKLERNGAFISGAFYMLTPVLFNKVIAGHLPYLLAYALAPLVIALFIRISDRSYWSYRQLFAAGLLYAICGVQIQFFIMLFIILLLWCFTKSWRRTLRRIYLLILICGIAFLIHLPWILSSYSMFSEALSGAGTLAWLSFQSTPLLDAIRLVGYANRYFDNAIIMLNIANIWNAVSFLIPMLAFSALIFKPRDRRVLYLTFMATVALFFSNGTNPPFSGVFVWFFDNVPLVMMFRELYHIMFIPALAYAVLIGITSQSIAEKVEKYTNKIYAIKISSPQIKISTATTCLLLIIIIFYSCPFLTGNFAGNVQLYTIDEEYKQIYDRLSNEPDDFRVLWIPILQPIQYDGLEYPGIDPLIDYSPKPSLPQFAQAETYSGKFALFLAFTLQENRTKYLGDLMKIANIKYGIVRDDFSSKYPNFVYMESYPDLVAKWSNNITEQVLKSQESLQVTDRIGNISIYLNNDFIPHIYVAENPILLSGDLSSLISLSFIKHIFNESLNAVFLASQFSPENTPIDHVNTIVISNNNYFDYVAMFIPDEYKIDPGFYATVNNDAAKGWIRAPSWWWYNWYFAAATENAAFTKVEDTLEIPFQLSNSDNYDLWIKVLTGPRSGIVKLLIDNHETQRVNMSHMDSSGFRWIQLSTLSLAKGKHNLKLISEGGENYIARIILCPSTIVQTAHDQASCLLYNKRVIYLSEAELTFCYDASNLVLNPSFEEWNTTSHTPIYWSRNGLFGEGFYGYLDSSEKRNNEYSYAVTTNQTTKNWSWIMQDVEILPNISYEITAYIKTLNSIDSHIAVDGYNSTSQKWERLGGFGFSAGSFDWKRFQLELNVPSNITKLRVWLNGGVCNDSSKGNATTWFDEVEVLPVNFASSKFGCESSNGEVQLVKNLKTWAPIEILESGTYTLALRGTAKSHISVGIGDHIYTIVPGSENLSWHYVHGITLEKGTHNLTLESDDAEIDLIMLNSSNDDEPLEEIFSAKPMASTISYERINPTKYVIQVTNSSSGFFLIFSESYGREWRATINGNEQNSDLTHFIVNSFANAWYVNKTGSFTISLDYVPQRVYDVGLKVSLLTITILIAFIIIPINKLTKLSKLLKERFSVSTKHH